MKAYDRFVRWQKEHRVEPDAYGWSVARVYEAAGKLGFSTGEVKGKIVELERWLVANAGTKKVNKRHWGRFILKCLTRVEKSARQTPSVFTGESGFTKTP